MLFHKSIISFVAAIALATIAAAAAIPPTTGTGSPNQGSSQPEGSSQGTQGSTQGSTLSQGQIPTCSPSLNPMCCETSIPFPNLSDNVRASLQTLDPNLNQNLNVGQNCAPPGTQGCGNLLPLCCDAVQSADGLPDIAPSCVSPNNSA